MAISENFAGDVAAISKIDAVTQILRVICSVTGLGFSAVARVTDTHWVACAVRDEIQFGLLPGGELELETTICHEIRSNGEAVAIDHVAEDERFCAHHTPLRYGFQSYISVPINLADGRFFGTLCAIDPKPANVNNPEILGMFALFADLIAMHLDAQYRLAANEAALQSEREMSKLREQFIAVLGHDLRNPLGAIGAGVQVLSLMPQSEEAAPVLEMIQRSNLRMGELIDNLLDFARGRLGDGISLSFAEDPGLETALRQVIVELQAAWPARSIEGEIHLDRLVACDSARLAQLLSNLLANALTHGDPSSPVWVRAQSSEQEFELTVTNLGPTIPPEILERFFEPFARGDSAAGGQGLGLGLYISSEIARAHQGTLTIASNEGKTCVAFHMPNLAAKG